MGGFYVLSTNLLGKHKLYLRPFFFPWAQHMSLYLVLLTQPIKFPMSLTFPPPAQPERREDGQQ